jgi:hypothetical protein
MGSTVITRYHRKIDIGDGLFGANRYYDILPTYNGVDYSGNLNVDLKFKFFTDIVEDISEINSLKVYRSTDGITWENKGGTVDLLNNNVTVTGFEHFSEITIAPDNGALPIELLSFTGNCKNEVVTLNWKTASEYQSSYFDIEKSRDGENWYKIKSIPAAGYSTETLNYSYNEEKVKDYSYYRLKQFDENGESETFTAIYVNCEENIKIFKTLPNPSNETFQVLIDHKELIGKAVINIIDTRGTIISSLNVEVSEGMNMFYMNENIVTGLYFVAINKLGKTIEITKHNIR